MTTLEETIYLMDWIREHGELGLTCMTNDGEYEHLPEYCTYATESSTNYHESKLRQTRKPTGESHPPSRLQISGTADASYKM